MSENFCFVIIHLDILAMSYIVLGMDIADAVQAVVVIWCKEDNQNGKLTSCS